VIPVWLDPIGPLIGIRAAKIDRRGGRSSTDEF
jgi:hypothetical protein